MTIWEKAILNMQKGTQKLSTTAAIFSERVKAEIAIARLRIRLDEVQSLIDEQYRAIGRKVIDLKKRSLLPKTTELLMKDEAIVTALAEIEAREKDRDDLHAEIAHEQAAFKPAPKQGEEATS
jgi:hypothetical protein